MHRKECRILPAVCPESMPRRLDRRSSVAYADLLRKVSGLCNNANQLAHVANSTGFAGRQNVDEMTRIAREVWRAVKEQWLSLIHIF